MSAPVLREVLWALTQLAALALPALLLVTGLGARLRRACARMARSNRTVTRVLFASLYLTLAALVAAPFDYSRAAPPTFAPWLAGESSRSSSRSSSAALFLWIPYTLILVASRAGGGLSPPPRWCRSPSSSSSRCRSWSIRSPPTTSRWKTLRSPPRSKRWPRAAACTTSPSSSAATTTPWSASAPPSEFFLQQDIATAETPEQIVGTVSHELKHYVMGDNYKALAIIAALMLFGFLLVQTLGRWAIRRWHKRFGFDDLADPASLPLLVLILFGFWLAVLPAFNWEDRAIEHEADRFWPRPPIPAPPTPRSMQAGRGFAAGIRRVRLSLPRDPPLARRSHPLRQ